MSDFDNRSDYAALLPPPSQGPRPNIPHAWWIGVLSTVAMGALFWSWWSDWPQLAAPLEIGLPVLSLLIVALSGGRISLAGVDFRNRRLSLVIVLFAPMIGLVIGTWRSFDHLTFGSPMLAPALGCALGAALIAFLVARLDREMSDGLMLLASGLAAFIWLSAVVVEANGWLPPRKISPDPVQVLDKRVSGGRYLSYYITIQPPGQSQSTEFEVSGLTYGKVAIDRLACLNDTVGGLGFEWLNVGACPGQSPTAEAAASDLDGDTATWVGIANIVAVGLGALLWSRWISKSIPSRDVRLIHERLERGSQTIEGLKRAGTEWGGGSAPTFRKYEVTLSGVGRGRPSTRIIGIQVTLLPPRIKDYTPDVARLGRDG